jgi:hypothetical protein
MTSRLEANMRLVVAIDVVQHLGPSIANKAGLPRPCLRLVDVLVAAHIASDDLEAVVETASTHRLSSHALHALDVARVKPGDRVRIDYTGSSRLALPGDRGRTMMRHYVASVLEAAK